MNGQMPIIAGARKSCLFVNCDALAVARCLVDWGNEEIVGRGTVSSHKEMGLGEVWRFLDERFVPPSRAVIVSMENHWSAFFNNHRDEYPPHAEPVILCKRLKATTCCFYFEDRPDAPYPGGASFTVCRFQEGRILERHVSIGKDDRWVFRQSGEPLSFEATHAYRNQDVRRRLSPELLNSYGEALGIRYWDTEGYGRDVFCLTWGAGPTTPYEKVRQRLLDAWERAKNP